MAAHALVGEGIHWWVGRGERGYTGRHRLPREKVGTRFARWLEGSVAEVGMRIAGPAVAVALALSIGLGQAEAETVTEVVIQRDH